jgi:subtilisin family serine protease
VVAYDLRGRPTEHSNLGGSIGRRGIGAPGDRVTSLGAEGKPLTLGGTSAAAPFVTGAVALLRSEFPEASATTVKLAITQPLSQRRTSVVPPPLDAWTSFQSLEATHKQRRPH